MHNSETKVSSILFAHCGSNIMDLASSQKACQHRAMEEWPAKLTSSRQSCTKPNGMHSFVSQRLDKPRKLQHPSSRRTLYPDCGSRDLRVVADAGETSTSTGWIKIEGLGIEVPLD